LYVAPEEEGTASRAGRAMISSIKGSFGLARTVGEGH